MFRNTMMYAVLTLALAVVLGACGKKNAKAAAQPSGQTLTPTSSVASDLEGSWKTSCISAGFFTDKAEKHTLKIQGDLLIETYVTFDDADCTVNPSAPVILNSHFKISSVSDAVYKEQLSYSDGDFSSISEKAVKTSNGLSFESEPNVFVQQ